MLDARMEAGVGSAARRGLMLLTSYCCSVENVLINTSTLYKGGSDLLGLDLVYYIRLCEVRSFEKNTVWISLNLINFFYCSL